LSPGKPAVLFYKAVKSNWEKLSDPEISELSKYSNVFFIISHKHSKTKPFYITDSISGKQSFKIFCYVL
jgi:hypothetical protein